MINREIIPYKVEHRAACISVLKSNIGQYFDQSELAGFEDFLDNHVFTTQYFVVTTEGNVKGCGGYYLNNGVVRLIEGMVDKTCHKTGLGKLLLEFRLQKSIEEHPDIPIGIDTSQHTEGFFNK